MAAAVCGTCADIFPRCELAVVYGGEEAQTRSVGRLIPWRKMHEDDVLGATKTQRRG